MTRKILITNSILIVFVSALLAACSAIEAKPPQMQTISLKLNWKHGTSFLGFYVAQSQGYYAAEGLDVSIEELSDPSLGADMPSQILSGEFEFGIGSSDLARAQAKGHELTAIGNIIKLGPASFFARKDSGINIPADFAGRTVVVKSLSWEEILEDFLEYGDLTIEDVEVYSGGYDMTPFYEGEVEIWAGFITEEAVQARLKGIELVTFPMYEYGGGVSSVTIFTSQEILTTDPDLAVHFLRASIRGWQYAIDNPSQAISDMLELYPALSDGFDYYLASFEAAIPLIIPNGTILGEIDCEFWNARDDFEMLKNRGTLCTRDIFLDAIHEE